MAQEPDRSDGYLPYEKPILEIEKKIKEFEELARTNNMDFSEELNSLNKKRLAIISEIYHNLSPWQKVELARHPRRPQALDYIERIFSDFIELSGDGLYGDDSAIITGLARLGELRVMVIAQHKGRDMKEAIRCNWGSPHPEGYRKALAKMQLAEKYRLPVVCLIDTKGAYPGVDAEERGQARAIAVNLREMASLRTPVACVVLSEGGSGGALGIAVGDHVAMFEYSYYSVISPEGCAAILWKDASKAPDAAAALKLTASDLLDLGVIDAVVPEPPGGAHRDPDAAANNLKHHLITVLLEFKNSREAELIEARYEKFRRIGRFGKGVMRQAEEKQQEESDPQAQAGREETATEQEQRAHEEPGEKQGKNGKKEEEKPQERVNGREEAQQSKSESPGEEPFADSSNSTGASGRLG